jgi:hypothetical protein
MAPELKGRVVEGFGAVGVVVSRQFGLRRSALIRCGKASAR